MEFRKKRKRYFGNIFVGITLHLSVTLLGVACAHRALAESSWNPIIGFLGVVLVLEGAYWWDVVHGWPMRGRPKERESK